MSSANAVVNALNWVGKATLGLEVVALAVVVVLGLAAAWNPRAPWVWRLTGRRYSGSRKSALVAAGVAAVMLVLALNTIASTQRLARAYRTVKGGMFLSSLV